MYLHLADIKRCLLCGRYRGKADIRQTGQYDVYDPKRTYRDARCATVEPHCVLLKLMAMAA